MTSSQRRPGFRLPWSSDSEGDEASSEPTSPGAAATMDSKPGAGGAEVSGSHAQQTQASTNDPVGDAATGSVADAPAETPAETPANTPAPDPRPAPPFARAHAQSAALPSTTPESSAGFMRDLVAAMRRVAEETRQAGLSDLRTKAEEQVRTLEADADRRRDSLRERAEADIASVSDWASGEEERIRQEAEQRVAGRRAQLDQQLAAETTRAETDAAALRDRVAAYERELDAYHARLSDIADPAAFASAAKLMPAPPRLADAPSTDKPSTLAQPPQATPTGTPAEAAPTDAPPDAADSVAAAAEAPRPGQAAPDIDTATETEAAPTTAAPTATEIVVKGLGSFGAITGFRQSLAAADGIEGVSLSLGPTGEFVFRALHAADFDVAGAIKALEGDAATIESLPDGALRVTLDRAR